MTPCLIFLGDIPCNTQKSPLLHVQHATKQFIVTVKKTYCTVCHSIINHLKFITSNKKVDVHQCRLDLFVLYLSVLPFYRVRDLHALDALIHSEYKTMEYQNNHLDVLKIHHCCTSIAHLNT